jgi:hypothetical protein
VTLEHGFIVVDENDVFLPGLIRLIGDIVKKICAKSSPP